MRRFLACSLVALALLPVPARAQQWVQLPACGNAFPAGINPSAATIAVNPSGQLCTAGSSTVVISTPLAINIPQVGAVVSGAYANGAIVTLGQNGDGAITTGFVSGSVISILKGILNNVLTPISVSGSFTANQTGNNIALVASQQIASPSTYGVAPIGSVLGVNAFITNNPSVTPPTPLQITFPASPLSVGIAAGSSPINVTGSLSVTPASPQNTNLVQVQGVTVASASTYGVAPVGSVQGVNAFVTSLPGTPLNVTVAGPTPLQITLPASPIGVGVTNSPTVVLSGSPVSVGIAGPTPLQITLPASPISVGIAGPTPLNVTVGGIVSPQNVTLATSPINQNLVQWQGIAVASPSTYGVAPVGSVGAVNAFVTNSPTVVLSGSPVSVGIAGPTPLNVTLATSPVEIAVSTVSSPINVTGSLSVTPASPQNTNLVQVDGQQVASPTTYGVAPVGSVQGVNAFVTSLPATPLNVTLAGPTPLNVTLVASPLNVTVSSPQANNLVQIQNVNIASPSTYGVAPVGSVQGVNAFVTNSPTVVLSGSPVSVGIAGPTPLNVTLATSPVEIAVSTVSSPINVTGSLSVTPASPQNTNLVQIDGQQVASPSSYGVAPVGSVQGMNAFITNTVNTSPSVSPQNVTIASTPLNVTLPASPISVGIAGPTPLNVTVGGIVSPQNITLATSPVGFDLLQIQAVNVASPSTYGVAPVGSVQGVNAFVTNSPTVVLSGSPVSVGIAGPTPLNVTISGSPQNMTLTASPVSVGIAGPTPLNMTLVAIPGSPVNVTLPTSPLGVAVAGYSLPPAANVIAWTATPMANVTNSAKQIVPTGVHQLGKVVCDGQSTSWGFLVIFDAATSGAVTLGTTQPKEWLPLAPSSLNGFVNPNPGEGFANGIVVAAVTTVPTGSSAIGTFVNCSMGYN